MKEDLSNHFARTKLETISRVPSKGMWNAFALARQRTPPALLQEYIGKAEADSTVIEWLGKDALDQAVRTFTQLQFSNLLTTFHTLATWRLSQGIYRFDVDVFSSVICSKMDCQIPGDLLLRLPERCVFIETPSLIFTFKNGTKSPIQGIWVRVEKITDCDECALVLQPLLEHADPGAFLHAIRLPMSGTLDRWDELTIENTVEVTANAGPYVDREQLRDVMASMKSWTIPALNLVLYLCSENSDIGAGELRPAYPSPKHTKKGERIFPPGLPTKWDVGVRLGAALRSAWDSGAGQSTGMSAEKRPHIRRAHWHGVRVGPMKHPDGTHIPTQQRRFELRWLPPISVKVTDFDELPATIRRV